MSFCGTWVLKEQEGYEDFMKLMGVPEQYITAGKNAPVILNIEKSGDQFNITTTTGPKSWTDQFEIGKPTKITGPGQKKMETVVQMVDGKMVGEYKVPNATITATREVDGDLLFDTLSVAHVVFRRIFERK